MFSVEKVQFAGDFIIQRLLNDVRMREAIDNQCFARQFMDCFFLKDFITGWRIFNFAQNINFSNHSPIDSPFKRLYRGHSAAQQNHPKKTYLISGQQGFHHFLDHLLYLGPMHQVHERKTKIKFHSEIILSNHLNCNGYHEKFAGNTKQIVLESQQCVAGGAWLIPTALWNTWYRQSVK